MFRCKLVIDISGLSAWSNFIGNLMWRKSLNLHLKGRTWFGNEIETRRITH